MTKLTKKCSFVIILIQLFNFLELIFTPEAYQKTTISSIFGGTSVRIEMDKFVKILFNKWNNRQSLLDLLKRIGNCCDKFILLNCKASHLQVISQIFNY